MTDGTATLEKREPTQVVTSLPWSAPKNHHSQALRLEVQLPLAPIRNDLFSPPPLLRSQPALRYPLEVMDKFSTPAAAPRAYAGESRRDVTPFPRPQGILAKPEQSSGSAMLREPGNLRQP